MPKKASQPSMYKDHQLQWDTPLQHLYLELEKRVQIEIENLEGSRDYYTQYKICLLREQLHRLLCVVIMKENMDDYIHLANNPQDNDIDLIDLSHKKLTTLDDLINYKVRILKKETVTNRRGAEYIKQHVIETLNIKELLNMARETLSIVFSSLFLTNTHGSYYGYYPVLWGKANSLSHFEESIEKNPICDVESYKQTRNNFFQDNIVNRDKLMTENTRAYVKSEPFGKNGPG